MARKIPAHRWKVRPREHVLADLSVNHVERQVFLAGFAVDRFYHDYGLDLIVTTFNERGEQESNFFLLQVKGTEEVKRVGRGREIAVRVEARDLRSWAGQLMPVFLAVYDAPADTAYWLYVQAELEERPVGNLATRIGTVTVHLPVANVLNRESILRFAGWKNQLAEQASEEIRHYE